MTDARIQAHAITPFLFVVLLLAEQRIVLSVELCLPWDLLPIAFMAAAAVSFTIGLVVCYGMSLARWTSLRASIITGTLLAVGSAFLTDGFELRYPFDQSEGSGARYFAILVMTALPGGLCGAAYYFVVNGGLQDEDITASDSSTIRAFFSRQE